MNILCQQSLLTFSHLSQVFPVGAHFCFFLPSNSSNACSKGSTTGDAHLYPGDAAVSARVLTTTPANSSRPAPSVSPTSHISSLCRECEAYCLARDSVDLLSHFLVNHKSQKNYNKNHFCTKLFLVQPGDILVRAKRWHKSLSVSQM